MANALRYHQGARPEMAGFIPDGVHRVLEIGCGEGEFRQYFPDSVEYWGVEPYAEAAAVAAHRLQTVRIGSFLDMQDDLPDGYFDLVVCNDVIEHMVDHDLFLQLIQRKMTPDARLIGSVPNVRYLRVLNELLLRRDWAYRDSGVLDRTHLRFFTRRSLQRTFSLHGYTIERLNGINGLKLWPPTAKKIGRVLAISLLGRDTRYLQYGFRLQRQANSVVATDNSEPGRYQPHRENGR